MRYGVDYYDGESHQTAFPKPNTKEANEELKRELRAKGYKVIGGVVQRDVLVRSVDGSPEPLARSA